MKSEPSGNNEQATGRENHAATFAPNLAAAPVRTSDGTKLWLPTTLGASVATDSRMPKGAADNQKPLAPLRPLWGEKGLGDEGAEVTADSTPGVCGGNRYSGSLRLPAAMRAEK
jgi:hypothetical protein